jgi:hypothetical protein
MVSVLEIDYMPEFGSRADRIAQLAPRPVLVVKWRQNRRPLENKNRHSYGFAEGRKDRGVVFSRLTWRSRTQ